MPEKYPTFLQSLHGTQLRWRRSDPVAAVARPRREGVDGSARTLAHRRIACIHVEPRVCDRIMAFLHLTFVACSSGVVMKNLPWAWACCLLPANEASFILALATLRLHPLQMSPHHSCCQGFTITGFTMGSPSANHL